MLMKFLLKIYNVLWYLFLPIILFYLWWRGRRLPAYRHRIAERFGKSEHQKVDVWMHAVSVGEVVATTSMVQACLDKGLKVLLTTMTPTGSEQVRRIWGDKVYHQYCPYDFSYAIERFLHARKPKILIIFETELWPGILSACHRYHIPVLLVNARISNRSYGRYLKTKYSWQYLFGFLNGIYVQSEEDKARFIALGAAEDRLHLAGNLKFQQVFYPSKLEAWKSWKTCYPDYKIVVFGSTHPGEEEQIIEAWKVFRNNTSDKVLAIIVPRHPERFESVYQLVGDLEPHAKSIKYSTWTKEIHALDYMILDVMGELSSVYAIADIAFVGGSLVPIGGHNVLEPLAYQVPVLCGPYMQNQQDLLRILLSNEAIVVVQNPNELALALKNLFADLDLRTRLIAQGQKTLKENKGALQICMQGVKALI